MESTTQLAFHLESSSNFNVDAASMIPLPSSKKWNEIDAALSRTISTALELVVNELRNMLIYLYYSTMIFFAHDWLMYDIINVFRKC